MLWNHDMIVILPEPRNSRARCRSGAGASLSNPTVWHHAIRSCYDICMLSREMEPRTSRARSRFGAWAPLFNPTIWHHAIRSWYDIWTRSREQPEPKLMPGLDSLFNPTLHITICQHAMISWYDSYSSWAAIWSCELPEPELELEPQLLYSIQHST